jgi:NhaP-type Na+/H+ or K+/H+ antiporter
VAAAWFGPKGFASAVYALLILKAGVAAGDRIFHLAAVVVAGSVIAHSSSDVLVARWFSLRSAGRRRASAGQAVAS